MYLIYACNEILQITSLRSGPTVNERNQSVQKHCNWATIGRGRCGQMLFVQNQVDMQIFFYIEYILSAWRSDLNLKLCSFTIKMGWTLLFQCYEQFCYCVVRYSVRTTFMRENALFHVYILFGKVGIKFSFKHKSSLARHCCKENIRQNELI